MVKLASSLSRLGHVKVLVMGDLLLDTYTIGKARRISPEAPVAIVHVQKEESLPGGAGNTALNLISLGAEVSLVGRVGSDRSGEQLKDVLNLENINTDWLVVQDHYPTPVKNRIIAENQQIVRIDHEQVTPLHEHLEQHLIDSLPALMEGIKVVAISDYGKGFLTPGLLQAVIRYANQHGIIVITDPKGHDFSKYEGTTIIKPNQSEAYAAAGMAPGSSLDVVAQKILQDTRAKMLMITRSEAGIALFESNGTRHDFPVHAKEVKDVTGAGDTVLAMLAYALANELSYDEAAELCNVAAGIAIEHVGCARVSLADLAQRLLDKDMTNKIFDQDHMVVLQEVLRSTPFTLMIVQNLENVTGQLFKAIKKIAGSESQILLYISDPNFCETALEILASLKEVNFILVHSDKVKEGCQKLNPQESYVFEDQELRIIPSFRDLFV